VIREKPRTGGAGFGDTPTTIDTASVTYGVRGTGAARDMINSGGFGLNRNRVYEVTLQTIRVDMA
jgi:hypothetical protein